MHIYTVSCKDCGWHAQDEIYVSAWDKLRDHRRDCKLERAQQAKMQSWRRFSRLLNHRVGAGITS